ncbi:EAL domain-containing protein [uncultured Thiodictyon sp.]|jgi:PleD family two-component response regulator/EAL domain-containing protein (putative c-di-GMP-specific phosphodiesterase class I)|uniref:EAL domain-containing protein n=1 Tax=uncultured Thiodictyon sp. TaxID=1846217 RepID=UPI0025DB4C5F|nr:EAL domain-containing protein [uncultured Thiodictyon sp.]
MHSDSTNRSVPASSVVYWGSDAGLPHRIRPLLERAGIALRMSEGPGDAPSVPADAGGCTVLILDTALLGADQTIKAFVDAVQPPMTKPPLLVVIAHSRAIEWRLQAMRADAAAFFVAPVAAGELVERLITLCRPGHGEASRVLVVDDSATQALLTERVLMAAGFVVRTLIDAALVLDVVAAFAPDLILMDLHMPLASGAELAAIIRDEATCRWVPILLYSVERDPERQAGALSLGGDAFLSKSIRPDLLVRAVTHRIEVTRTLRRTFGDADHLDPDTGLATRRHFFSHLERARTGSDGPPPGQGLLVVALEGAGRLDEQRGTGAALLATDRIGSLIVDRLEQSDLAVRLDDYRHALLIRRESDEALRTLAEGLRAAVAAMPIQVAGSSVTIGVSVGVGRLSPNPVDAVTLIARAADACDRALAAGGGCTLADEPPAAAPVDAVHEGRITAMVARALGGADRASGFRLFYQPMIAVQYQELRFVEVMLCLAAGDSALMAAADFLPSAERAGRVAEIDRWVMVRALTVLMHQCHAQPGLRLFVRQHMVSLTQDGCVAWLRAQVLAHGLSQRRPILQLSLDDLLIHRQTGAVLVGVLRKIGIEVCVMDLIDNPAALALVAEIRPPFVKLAAAMARETKPARLTELVGQLTRGGAEVIASGIDAPALVGAVWASGVRFAQGAAIQAPLPEPVFDLGEVEAG